MQRGVRNKGTSDWMPSLVCLALAALALVLYSAACRYWRPTKRLTPGELAELRRNYSPLVEAIHEYESDLGEPPQYLRELVPDYLVALPRLTPGRVAGFHYSAPYGVSDYPEWSSRGTYLWYVLSESPEMIMLPGQHRFFTRLEQTPLLLLRLNGASEVSSARLVGSIPYAEGLQFDPSRWKRDREVRRSMARSALRQESIVGRSVEAVEAVLGEPDGRGELVRSWSIGAVSPFNASFIDPPGQYVYQSVGKTWQGP